MNAPAAYESLHEKKHLEKLERAAAEADEPRRIEQDAAAEHDERPARLAWTLPYLTAAVVAFALLAVVRWEPAAIALPGDAAETIGRALKGVLAAIAVLAISRAVEVYFIERLKSPVSRFNLKRVLRLLIAL